jgi:hypothetical protein
VGTDDAERIAVNARLMRGLDPKRVRRVQKNNGNDGVFWTKFDSPVLPTHDARRTTQPPLGDPAAVRES